MSTQLNLGIDFKTMALLRVFQTLGLAFIFIPSNVLSYVGIPREKSNQISSMINFVRNVGGSIGIAVISTLVTRTTQVRENYLSANMNNGNPMFRQIVSGLTATLRSKGLSATEASRQAYDRVSFLLQQQAAGLAYRDVISMLAVMVACLVPLVFIMKKPPAARRDVPPAH
jgi:DHA2 family multidrug resistance protein